MWRSPAGLLFNRKVKGKIPDLSIDHTYDHEVHDRDAEQKAKSKAYADIHRTASPSSIELGDEVLVQQDKTKKTQHCIQPKPLQGRQQDRKQPRSRESNREPILQKHRSCEVIH